MCFGFFVLSLISTHGLISTPLTAVKGDTSADVGAVTSDTVHPSFWIHTTYTVAKERMLKA